MNRCIRNAGRAAAAILLGGVAALVVAEPSTAIPMCGPEDLECEIPDPTAEPLDATFTWFMPRRFNGAWDAWDEQGAVVQPAAAGYAQSYVNPDGFRVYLNACRTRGDRTVRHSWHAAGDGVNRVVGSGGCLQVVRLPEGRYEVTHTELGGGNETAVQTRAVSVQDHLIVSLGDSNASGEGNPDDSDWGPGDELDWKDDRCHRSATSGPALAAKALEDADPHSSVTFLSLACSGAEIGSGLLDNYAGIEPPVRVVDEPRRHYVPVNYLPPQVDAAKRQLCGGADATCARGVRTVDALLISIGVNDLGFADLIKECAKPTAWFKCHLEDSVTTSLSYAFAQLPGKYASLADALTGPLAEAPVYLTEYPADPFDSHDGCGVLAGVGDAEANWLADQGAYLNRLIRSAALQHGWVSVGGIAEAFAGHGYCSEASWFRSLSLSYIKQNNIHGALHPDHGGHSATAAATTEALAHAEALDPAPTHRATIRVEAVRITDPAAPDAGSYETGVHFRSSATATGPGGASAHWDVETASFPASGEVALPLGQWVELPAQPYTLTVDLARWQDLRLVAHTRLPPAPPPESCDTIGKYVPGCFDTAPRPLSIDELLAHGGGWSQGTHTGTAHRDGANLQVRYTVSVSPLASFPLEAFDPPSLPRRLRAPD